MNGTNYLQIVSLLNKFKNKVDISQEGRLHRFKMLDS